jgi:phosphatidylserine decarboxylase
MTSKPRKSRALYEARFIFFFLLCISIIAAAHATWVFHLPSDDNTMAFFSIGIIIPLCIIFFFFCLWFFRDPDRCVPGDLSLAVSPADGTITIIDEVEETQYFARRMKRISIFLSIHNVHVSRSPIAGEVLFTEGRGGLHFTGSHQNARRPEASILNESLLWIFGKTDAPYEKAIGVKQITGAIVRRIVPWAEVGEEMCRGERFGMIRFGSRTDIFLPLDTEILVSVGDAVRGGSTGIARWL